MRPELKTLPLGDADLDKLERVARSRGISVEDLVAKMNCEEVQKIREELEGKRPRPKPRVIASKKGINRP